MISIESIKDKINSLNRKHCFELLGFDFFIDCFFHVWLIEINTNPCIEESSKLLQMLIPRMLNDALRLTVDQIFPPVYLEDKNRFFPVEGHGDEENIFKLLINL